MRKISQHVLRPIFQCLITTGTLTDLEVTSPGSLYLFFPVSPVWERTTYFTFLQILLCGKKLPEVHLFPSTVVRLGGWENGLVEKGKESHLQHPVKPTDSLFRIFNTNRDAC